MANQTLGDVFWFLLRNIFLFDSNYNRRKLLLAPVLVGLVLYASHLNTFTTYTHVLCSYLFMPWLFPGSDLVCPVLSASIVFLSLTYTNPNHLFIFKKQVLGRLL